jgi:predicted CxxxxCH...CXXCH cytochrome family protein
MFSFRAIYPLLFCSLALALAACGSHELSSGLPAGVELSEGNHDQKFEDGQVHGPQFMKNPASCRSCHGEKLDGGLAKVSCDKCHEHENWTTNCAFCHGGEDNNTGAPPKPAYLANEETAVGVHSMHVEETDIHLAFACETCHEQPADIFSPSHLDGDGCAEVRFGELNERGVYSPENGACISIYCHGNGRGDGDRIWTEEEAATCASCHNDGSDAQQMSGAHAKHLGMGFTCDKCHGETISENLTISDKSLHLNGVPDVKLISGEWQEESENCTNTCHEDRYWQ